jgi:hypothetical protein
LLVAADVKEKGLSNQTYSSLDAEKLLVDYKGFLIFSVKLLGNDKNFAQGCIAVIKQGHKNVKVHQANVPPEAAETDWSPKTYLSQNYFYFIENEIDLAKPIILEINRQDNEKSRFYFNFPKIK